MSHNVQEVGWSFNWILISTYCFVFSSELPGIHTLFCDNVILVVKYSQICALKIIL